VKIVAPLFFGKNGPIISPIRRSDFKAEPAKISPAHGGGKIPKEVLW